MELPFSAQYIVWFVLLSLLGWGLFQVLRDASPISRIRHAFRVFRPLWKHRDPEIRFAAVQELHDQDIFAQVAHSDPDPRIRLFAVNKLQDQDALEHIAANDEDSQVRALAVKSVDRLEALLEIIKGNDLVEVRKEAVKKIKDTRVLAELLLVKGLPARLNRQITDKLCSSVDKIGNWYEYQWLATHPAMPLKVKLAALPYIQDLRTLLKMLVDPEQSAEMKSAVSMFFGKRSLFTFEANDPYRLDVYEETDLSIQEVLTTLGYRIMEEHYDEHRSDGNVYRWSNIQIMNNNRVCGTLHVHRHDTGYQKMTIAFETSFDMSEFISVYRGAFGAKSI